MKQFFFERECVHRDNGRDGEIYNGMFYVQAIQRLTIEAAMKVAKQVAPFYWVDEPRVMVWLCRDCATELHIGEAPRAHCACFAPHPALSQRERVCPRCQQWAAHGF